MTRQILNRRTLPGALTEYAIVQNADNSEATIWLYDEIGLWGVTAKQFQQDLLLVNAPTINLRINSPGGEVFDAFAMYQALKEKDAKIVAHIDGWAASAASYVALAADEVLMSESAYFMIHNVWTIAIGDAEAMRKQAELLDKLNGTITDIYVAATGKDRADIIAKMNAETWFTAQEAVDYGFAGSIKSPEKKASALFDVSGFKNTPAPVKRAAENALRDAGLTRREAKAALTEPLDLNRQRDADGDRSQRDAELQEITDLINKVIATLTA